MVHTHCFTPYQFEKKEKSFYESAVENVTDYFYLGGKKISLVETAAQDLKANLVEGSPQPWLLTRLKVITYFTLIIPALMYLAKVILCAFLPTYRFEEPVVQVIAPDRAPKKVEPTTKVDQTPAVLIQKPEIVKKPTNLEPLSEALTQLENRIEAKDPVWVDKPYGEISAIKKRLHTFKMGENPVEYEAIALRIVQIEGKILKAVAVPNPIAPAPPLVEPAKPVVAPPIPVSLDARVKEAKEKMQREMPVLWNLIRQYSLGNSIKLADYEDPYIQVMTNELGMAVPQVYTLSKMGKIMEAQEAFPIFSQICERVEIEDLLSISYDQTVDDKSKRFGCLLTGDGHNSFALFNNKTYGLVPEYEEDLAHERRTLVEMYTEAGIAAKSPQPFFLNVPKELIVAEDFRKGKITNINGCALESVIFCFAHFFA